ncbi:hypothetical protein [Phytobacter massiliensis]|uniref:hypothetical protein n=1 Tax=Phytobacter massiliensis TaxID=1485952 RepID=UPI0005C5B9B6|nr:hypothetical protein [Phytobacter massiliensis]
MGLESIIALVISGVALIWTIFRDKSGDNDELINRISMLEGKVSNQASDIDRLERGQDELEKSMASLQEQIHKLDIKIERILTILEENKKGQ